MGARNQRPTKDKTHKHNGHPQIQGIKAIGPGPVEVIHWSWGSPTQTQKQTNQTKRLPSHRIMSNLHHEITETNHIREPRENMCAGEGRAGGGRGGGAAKAGRQTEKQEGKEGGRKHSKAQPSAASTAKQSNAQHSAAQRSTAEHLYSNSIFKTCSHFVD